MRAIDVLKLQMQHARIVREEKYEIQCVNNDTSIEKIHFDNLTSLIRKTMMETTLCCENHLLSRQVDIRHEFIDILIHNKL